MELRDKIKNLIPISCRYYDKNCLHSDSRYSDLLCDPSIFKGLLYKEEKDALFISELKGYKDVSEALWIIESFENNWVSAYYSESSIREKILKSHPEIFITKKNNKIYCIVNFKNLI
jgi:hypothetical protein